MSTRDRFLEALEVKSCSEFNAQVFLRFWLPLSYNPCDDVNASFGRHFPEKYDNFMDKFRENTFVARGKSIDTIYIAF